MLYKNRRRCTKHAWIMQMCLTILDWRNGNDVARLTHAEAHYLDIIQWKSKNKLENYDVLFKKTWYTRIGNTLWSHDSASAKIIIYWFNSRFLKNRTKNTIHTVTLTICLSIYLYGSHRLWLKSNKIKCAVFPHFTIFCNERIHLFVPIHYKFHLQCLQLICRTKPTMKRIW